MNASTELATPRLIRGGIAVDDRGALRFVNDFQFPGVKRFYCVTNHQAGFVRAWHAHRREAKFVTVLQGAAIVGAVRIDDWESPNPAAVVERHVLSSAQPAVLAIPAGYANGFMTLTADTIVVFFSTATLEESAADDVRFPARFWDIWQVEAR